MGHIYPGEGVRGGVEGLGLIFGISRFHGTFFTEDEA